MEISLILCLWHLANFTKRCYTTYKSHSKTLRIMSYLRETVRRKKIKKRIMTRLTRRVVALKLVAHSPYLKDLILQK